MNHWHRLFSCFLCVLAAIDSGSCNSASSRQSAATTASADAGGPIIDMHLHAYPANKYGPTGVPNPMTGKPSAARTDEAVLQATLAAMRRYRIERGVVGGPAEVSEKWRAAASEQFIRGAELDEGMPLPSIAQLRADYRAGKLGALGEIGAQYVGLPPGDASLEPYYQLAEELNIPVGIHTGLGPPGSPYTCCPKFRTRLGNPALLEELLVRHPKLRIYIMHAGWPYLQETVALMHMYPQLYADLAVINWAIPRAEFHDYLRRLMQAGMGERLMFGSDQMIWPEAIGMAIEGTASAPFLTSAQKRNIFYNNAARFLNLAPAVAQQ